MSLKLKRSLALAIAVPPALLLFLGILYQVTLGILLPAVSCTVLGSCLTLYLICRRMEREVAQHAAAERYAALLLESVGEGMIGVTEGGSISFVNRAALALLGYETAEELMGRDAGQLLHQGDDCPSCRQQCCLLTPPFGADRSLHSESQPLRRKDGSSFSADLSRTSIRSGGKILGAVLTFRDLTETREILQRLRLKGAALDAAANSILIADREGKAVWVNHSFTRATGYRREEVLGRDPYALLRWHRYEMPPQEIHRAASSKNPWHGEVVTRRKDGTLYDEDVTITPVLDDRGEITHFVGIMIDVTERKRSESALIESNLALEEANDKLVQAMGRSNELALEAEQASAAKSRFLANMSHEIRTPMNAIMAVSHLLRDSGLSAQQSDHLQTLTASAELLLRTLDQVLDISRIEAGKLEIDRVEFAPRQVVEELAASCSVRAEQLGLQLRTEVGPEIPPLLLGDPQRLSQLLGNLLDNALKFTRQGSIELKMRLTGRSRKSVELEFSVRDPGIGIAPADQGQLFQAFTQVDGSTTRSYGGAGLGLAICRQLASLMGGNIWCESAPGRGSTFSFRLPFTLPAPEGAAASGNGGGSRETLFQGERILLVEDNPFNQKVAVALLEHVGLQVGVAGNGAEALELIQEERFDLVLMDIQMPVLDGLAATRRIRKLPQPGLDKIPILALSAHSTKQDVAESLAAGMNAHITKPFAPDALYDAIALWLERQ